MLIWRGPGYLLPLLTIGVFVQAEKRLPVFVANQELWVAAGLASAGLVCMLWGLIANRGGTVQAVDRLTGLIVNVRVRHSRFGIRMQGWGALSLLTAVVVYILRGP
jgi:hypothetical protein